MTTVTIGIDLGDKNHEVCVLDNAGEVIDRFMVGNTKIQLQKAFAKYAGALVRWRPERILPGSVACW